MLIKEPFLKTSKLARPMFSCEIFENFRAAIDSKGHHEAI